MSLIDNNLQTRSNHGYVGNFQNVNLNYQTICSDSFQIQNLLQAEGTEKNITSSSPNNDSKCLLNHNTFY